MGKEQHALGKDVTATFKAGQAKETVVLSVRLQQSEFKALEQIAVLEGKTVSQIAREAMTREIEARSGPEQGFTVQYRETLVTFGSPLTAGTVGQAMDLNPSHQRRKPRDFVLVE